MRVRGQMALTCYFALQGPTRPTVDRAFAAARGLAGVAVRPAPSSSLKSHTPSPSFGVWQTGGKELASGDPHCCPVGQTDEAQTKGSPPCSERCSPPPPSPA